MIFFWFLYIYILYSCFYGVFLILTFLPSPKFKTNRRFGPKKLGVEG